MNTLLLIFISAFFFFGIFFNYSEGSDYYQIALSGQKLYEQGKFAQAQEVYLKAKRLFPDNGQIDYNLGNTDYQLGYFKKAIKSWQAAAEKIDLEQFRQKVYYNIGNAFYREERYKEAAGYYQKALKLNPDDKSAEFNLKLALRRFAAAKKKKEGQAPDNKKDNNKEINNNSHPDRGADKQKKTAFNKPKNNLSGRKFQAIQYREDSDGRSGQKISLDEAKNLLKGLKEGKYKIQPLPGDFKGKSRNLNKYDW